MKLLLHIGTHKTGTTAIQRALSSRKKELLNMGVWYPQYSEVLGGQKSNYAHLDIARALMNEKCLLNQGEASEFLQNLHKKASELPGVTTVVISAETLLRGKLGKNKKKWTLIQNFQHQIMSYLSDFENIEVHVTFRNYIEYLESLFNEHVKATIYSKSIVDFHSEFLERFNYRNIVSTWEKNVGTVNVTAFSELAKGNVVENWVREALGNSIAELFVRNENHASRNASWPLSLVEIKRKVNAYNDYELSSLTRTKLELFSMANLKNNFHSSKMTWLSKDYKELLSKTYISDRDWLASNYNPSCSALCDVSDREIELFEGIEERDWIEFLKFNINGSDNQNG